MAIPKVTEDSVIADLGKIRDISPLAASMIISQSVAQETKYPSEEVYNALTRSMLTSKCPLINREKAVIQSATKKLSKINLATSFGIVAALVYILR